MNKIKRSEAKITKNDIVFIKGESMPFAVDVCHRDGSYTLKAINRSIRVPLKEIDRVGHNGRFKLI